MRSINHTHDPNLRSWVETANSRDAAFPIQNLPLGVFRRGGTTNAARVGVAIGDQILDLQRCRELGLLNALPDDLADAVSSSSLKPLMASGAHGVATLRQHVSEILHADTPLADATVITPMADTEMQLPVEVGDYSDFYASIFHAKNVGRLFRPDNPLLPNYMHVPIGYHGRTSSIGVSGTPVRRPLGQTKPHDLDHPRFEASRQLDYELEVGIFVGKGNALGRPVSIDDAEDHVFGLCLLNDWSARDIQAWESQPLGPFLAKSFATSISPWLVTMDALAPFRCPAFTRRPETPRPLQHLSSERNERAGGIAITLDVLLRSAEMRRYAMDPVRVSRGSFQDMFWTVAQMITHQASNGCNQRPGDLLGSGTVSGPDKGSEGCLLEMTQRGTRPLELPTGEQRSFLADGDEVVLRGYCEREGYTRIGLGECVGIILPALASL